MQIIRDHEVRYGKVSFNPTKVETQSDEGYPDIVNVEATVTIELETEHEELDHKFDLRLVGNPQPNDEVRIDPEMSILFPSHPQNKTRKTLKGAVQSMQPGQDEELENLLLGYFKDRPIHEAFEAPLHAEVDVLTARQRKDRVAVKLFAVDKRGLGSDLPDACWVVDLLVKTWSEYGNQFVGADMKLVGESIDEQVAFNFCRQAFPDIDM